MKITTDNFHKNQQGPPIPSVYANQLFLNKGMLGIDQKISQTLSKSQMNLHKKDFQQGQLQQRRTTADPMIKRKNKEEYNENNQINIFTSINKDSENLGESSRRLQNSYLQTNNSDNEQHHGIDLVLKAQQEQNIQKFLLMKQAKYEIMNSEYNHMYRQQIKNMQSYITGDKNNYNQQISRQKLKKNQQSLKIIQNVKSINRNKTVNNSIYNYLDPSLEYQDPNNSLELINIDGLKFYDSKKISIQGDQYDQYENIKKDSYHLKFRSSSTNSNDFNQNLKNNKVFYENLRKTQGSQSFFQNRNSSIRSINFDNEENLQTQQSLQKILVRKSKSFIKLNKGVDSDQEREQQLFEKIDLPKDESKKLEMQQKIMLKSMQNFNKKSENFIQKNENILFNNLSAITYQNDLVSKSQRNIFQVKEKETENYYSIFEEQKAKFNKSAKNSTFITENQQDVSSEIKITHESIQDPTPENIDKLCDDYFMKEQFELDYPYVYLPQRKVKKVGRVNYLSQEKSDYDQNCYEEMENVQQINIDKSKINVLQQEFLKNIMVQCEQVNPKLVGASKIPFLSEQECIIIEEKKKKKYERQNPTCLPRNLQNLVKKQFNDQESKLIKRLKKSQFNEEDQIVQNIIKQIMLKTLKQQKNDLSSQKIEKEIDQRLEKIKSNNKSHKLSQKILNFLNQATKPEQQKQNFIVQSKVYGGSQQENKVSKIKQKTNYQNKDHLTAQQNLKDGFKIIKQGVNTLLDKRLKEVERDRIVLDRNQFVDVIKRFKDLKKQDLDPENLKMIYDIVREQVQNLSNIEQLGLFEYDPQEVKRQIMENPVNLQQKASRILMGQPEASGKQSQKGLNKEPKQKYTRSELMNKYGDLIGKVVEALKEDNRIKEKIDQINVNIDEGDDDPENFFIEEMLRKFQDQKEFDKNHFMGEEIKLFQKEKFNVTDFILHFQQRQIKKKKSGNALAFGTTQH